MRFQPQLHALTLEYRQEFLQRAPELRLAAAGRLRPPVELGVHHGAVQLDGQLDGPLPVAHCGLPLFLVRAGPAVQGQVRGHLDPGAAERGLELCHPAGVRSRCRKNGVKSSRGDSSMYS